MIDRFERFFFAIAEINKYWHKLASEEMEKYNLKATHSVYLLALMRHPIEGLTASQICEKCGRDKADVSRMMSIMESKGLVERNSIHHNLYKSVFRLTERGREAADHVKQRASFAVELAGINMSDSERNAFYNALETIVTNMRELSKSGLPDKR